LLGENPNEIMIDPQPKPPEAVKVSVSKAEDLINPIFLATLDAHAAGAHAGGHGGGDQVVERHRSQPRERLSIVPPKRSINAYRAGGPERPAGGREAPGDGALGMGYRATHRAARRRRRRLMLCERCYRPADEGDHGLYKCPLQPRAAAPVIWADDIPGGVELAHGLCHPDGTPRRFDSRSAIRRAAAEKGLDPVDGGVRGVAHEGRPCPRMSGCNPAKRSGRGAIGSRRGREKN
jgi:hypothetical protein